MQRNGVLKVYYDDTPERCTFDLTDVSAEELNAIMQYNGVEITSLSERNSGINGIVTYDITGHYIKNNGGIVIDPVPIEEFRINSDHNSIDVSQARFTAHVFRETVSDLRKKGYDYDEIEDLPSDTSFSDREYRFQLQGETNYFEENYSADKSQRLIEIAECFLDIDVDDTGIAEKYKVTVAGGEAPSNLLDIEPVNSYPWVATTCILMSHKFIGLSIYDRLRQIQDQKTSLWRNMLDNMYLQNNIRYEAVTGQVNLDDLLTSRAGGVIRVKRSGAVNPIITPQITDSAYKAMNYLDQVAAGRTGVSAEGGMAPQEVGDRVGSEGVERLMNAKEELVGLIIRVIAETGVKPLCMKVRELLIEHTDAIIDYQYKGDWVKINPATWPSNRTCQVRVGTGSGNTMERKNALATIFALQEKIASRPDLTLVDQQKMYNAADDYCKLNGLTGADAYFIDPSSEQGQMMAQQQQQMSMVQQQSAEQEKQAIVNAQVDMAKAELLKAQAQLINTQTKAESEKIDAEQSHQKQVYETQISSLKQQLEEAKLMLESSRSNKELEFRYDELNTNTALRLTEIEASTGKPLNNEFNNNLDTVGASDEEN